MYKLSIKLNKDNDKLEKGVNEFKTYILFHENSNKIIGEEKLVL